MTAACTCSTYPDIWCEAHERFPNHPGSLPERAAIERRAAAAQHARLIATNQAEDNEASLRLVQALRDDPERGLLMSVIAALGKASEGTPQHYAWNKLWWLLYVPEPPKPRAKARRRKQP